MSLRSSKNITILLRSTLSVDADVVTLRVSVTKPVDALGPATVLRLKTEDWTLVNYESEYVDFFNVRQLNAMFFGGHNASIPDQRCGKCDAVIEG